MKYRLLSAALLCSPLTAQGALHLVDESGACPGSFQEISAAVAAAAPGDTIVVSAGKYAPFKIEGKGLVVTAASGADVRIVSYATQPGLPPARVRDVPAGETVVLRGLTLRTKHPGHGALVVQDCNGLVWIEDCVLVPAAGGLGVAFPGPVHPTVELSNESGGTSHVLFTRCTIAGRNAPAPGSDSVSSALGADGCNVAFWDTELSGGYGPDGTLLSVDGGRGLPAAVISGTAKNYVFASGCSFRGGDGGDGILGTCTTGGDAGDGLQLTGPTLWAVDPLSDSTCLGVDCQFTGGTGGSGNLCGAGANGAGVVGSSVLMAGDDRSLASLSPVSVGGQDQLTYRGIPADTVVLFYTDAPGMTLEPQWSSVVSVDLASSWSGVADSLGEIVWTAPVAMAGFVAAKTAFVQPAASPDGVAIRWGAPSAVTHTVVSCP